MTMAYRIAAAARQPNETYSTNNEIDLDRGYAIDADSIEVEGRCGRKHEVGDTDEDSDDDTDDDMSSCLDGDNYKANTKALIDRIEGRVAAVSQYFLLWPDQGLTLET
jgi:hypothetical protein